jgi:putative lipoprotein
LIAQASGSTRAGQAGCDEAPRCCDVPRGSFRIAASGTPFETRQRIMLKHVTTIVVALACAGCTRSETTEARAGTAGIVAASQSESAAPAAGSETPGFVNRVWRVERSSGVAPGTLYVFLSEGTLVIASEHGTPALGQWKSDGGRLIMIEEGHAYDVSIRELSRDAFRITVSSPGEPLDIALVPAATAGSAVAMSAADPNTGGVVSGTVAYRERIALPADAVVEVALLDVTRADASSPVIGQTTVQPAGRQVPLPYSIQYDPTRIEAGHRYAVRASIRSGGQLILTTDTAYHVITQGNPTRADLMLVRVSQGANPAASAPLVGTSWRLVDLGGAGVLDSAQATLEFPEAGKVAGRGSCNRFFGTFTATVDTIRISPLGATQMACPGPISQQESKYLKALQGAERFVVDGTELSIHCRDLERPLRFVRASE